jgi:RNA polymerase-binding transcription factor DksA
MLDQERIRQQLTERLAELRTHVANIEADLGQPLDDDFAEQATDREDDQALDAVEQSALAEIELITRAMGKLEVGTYGICAACGNAIAAKRLEAMPAAALCIACAR